MIKIIRELSCEDSIGCKNIINSLIKSIKKKRYEFEIVEKIDHIEKSDNAYLVGQNIKWMNSMIKQCNENGIIPTLLLDQPCNEFKGRYHLICPDTTDLTVSLIEKLKKSGRKKVALYGLDRGMEKNNNWSEALVDIIDDVENIYQSKGNLENCFRDFLPKIDYYDAVICVNGYAAFSLAKKLEKEYPSALETLVILSFEEVLKQSKYNQYISLVDLQLEAYGAAAMAVVELVKVNNHISNIALQMKVHICDIASQKGTDKGNDDSVYHKDPEIAQMEKIEQLFQNADDMDHHIIAMLLDGAKYIDIADTCYMTEGNVKYRVKKYMSICGCKGKKELLELLQEYLQ